VSFEVNADLDTKIDYFMRTIKQEELFSEMLQLFNDIRIRTNKHDYSILDERKK